MKEVSLFWVLCHQVPWIIQQQANVLPSLSLADEIPAAAFLVVLHALTNLIPACSDSISTLFPGHLCLLLSLVCFLFPSDFSQNLGLCLSLKIFFCLCLTSCMLLWVSLEPGRGDFWKSGSSPALLSRDISYRLLLRKSLNKQKNALQRLSWSCFLACTLLSGPWTPPSLQPKAVPDLHICNNPQWQIVKPPMRIKFCKYKVSSSCLERPHLFLLSARAVCSRCPPQYPILVCLLIVTKEENGSVGTLRKWEIWGETNVDSVDGAYQ